MVKRMLCMLLALLLLAGICPLPALSASAVSEESVPEPELFVLESDLAETLSPEEAFSYYANTEFFPDQGAASISTVARDRLTGAKGRLYDAMKPFIQDIANGKRKSAVLTLGTPMYDLVPDVKVNLSNLTFDDYYEVMKALEFDMPYEMYWYRVSCFWTWKQGSSRYIKVMFDIHPPFHDGSYTNVTFSNGSVSPYHHTANTARTGAARQAAANARQLVSRYEGKTDYEKLLGYARWIADAVAYDYYAADNDTSKINITPNTLINVFDNNPATNIVCEGYAKALQYLCDLSTFSRVTCHYITGYPYINGINQGYHAWNLVDVEGIRYLIDVTGYDSGTNGRYSDLYFMAGVPMDKNGRYPIASWSYEHLASDVALLFGNDGLNLSKTYYDPSSISYTAAEKVNIVHNGAVLTGSTLNLSLEETLDLDAQVLPSTARPSVKWLSSDTSIAKISAEGLVTPLKTGKVTITATTRDDTKTTASVTVKVIRKMTSLKLPETLNLTAGKSYTFKPEISPSATTNKTLKWELTGDTQSATLNSKGVLTAKKVTERSAVTVSVRSTDGSNLEAQCCVTIYPPATRMSIYHDGARVSGDTLKLPLGSTLDLDPKVSPSSARQSAKWKSSDTKIATVDAYGVVTPLKKGTVTLTATARDGTKEKSTVTIQVVRLVSSVTLPETLTLTAGSRYTFKPGIAPSSASSKSLRWKLSGDTEAAELSSKGVLTVGKVKEATTVTVTARTRDGSDITAACVVTILPDASKVTILNDGEAVSSASVRIGQKLRLSAIITPEEALQDVTWSSSNTRIAGVSEKGVVKGKARGTVTITARATDGSGRKATLKVTVK